MLVRSSACPHIHKITNVHSCNIMLIPLKASWDSGDLAFDNVLLWIVNPECNCVGV